MLSLATCLSMVTKLLTSNRILESLLVSAYYKEPQKLQDKICKSYIKEHSSEQQLVSQ